jgi:hypothetical protein
VKVFGYYLSEKGEIIGTYQNKKYKVGEWKATGKKGENFNINTLFYQEKDIRPIH